MLATSAQLERLPSGGEVAVAGLVIARQRPGTANGTMFLLFEDEFGTINLIVPRDGLRAPSPAAAPSRCCSPGAAWSARGRGPSVNVIVGELASRSRRFLSERRRRGGGVGRAGARASPAGPAPGRADDATTPVDAEEEPDGAEVGSSMRAAAPPVQSFAIGRRR